LKQDAVLAVTAMIEYARENTPGMVDKMWFLWDIIEGDIRVREDRRVQAMDMLAGMDGTKPGVIAIRGYLGV